MGGALFRQRRRRPQIQLLGFHPLTRERGTLITRRARNSLGSPIIFKNVRGKTLRPDVLQVSTTPLPVPPRGLMWPDGSGGHDRAGSADRARAACRAGRPGPQGARAQPWVKSTPRAAAASPLGEGWGDNPTTKAETHRPALVPGRAASARHGGPSAAQTPSPGEAPAWPHTGACFWRS